MRFRLGRRAFETLIEGCARTVKGRLARDVDEMGERIFRQDVSNTSVGEMIGQVAEDLSLLLRQELDLAMAEVKQEITKADKAACSAGPASLHMMLLFGSIAAWWRLANVMDQAGPL